jgi:hypothetical protein
LPLDDVIASAMALEPDARPQHAEELSRALRRFLAGVDLGDVARQLGERVRLARARPAPAADQPRPILQRPPSRPTATQVGTKTFAVRDELRAIEAPPPVVLESSTRRLESKRPAASDEGAAARLEPTTDGAGRRRGSSRVAMASLAVTAVVAAAASVALGRGARSPDAVAVAHVDALPAAPSAPAVSPAVEPPPTPAPSPRPPAGAPSSERAQLVLLGDGTFVSVDGTPRGACPARLAVDPGAHSVVFSFPATGESKSDALTLRAGDRMTLRADFTGVTPTIRSGRF